MISHRSAVREAGRPPESADRGENRRPQGKKVMEFADFSDYRRGNLFQVGMAKGLTLSVLVHVGVFLMALKSPWLWPTPKGDVPRLMVNLVSIQDLAGGRESGTEGGPGSGSGESSLAEGSPTAAPPSPEESRPATQPEPAAAAPIHPHVFKTEVAPPHPFPQKVERPAAKPKPHPKVNPKVEKELEKTSTADPPAPSALATIHGEPGSEAARHGHDKGTVQGDAEGFGKGSAGEGTGVGSGSGAGGGPHHAAFGSADGPRFANRVMPKYPRLARELGREGSVLLLLTIDEHGRLVDAQVVKGGGSGFEEEALRAVKSSTFHPAVRNGKPVLCRTHLPIHFQLKGNGEN